MKFSLLIVNAIVLLSLFSCTNKNQPKLNLNVGFPTDQEILTSYTLEVDNGLYQSAVPVEARVMLTEKTFESEISSMNRQTTFEIERWLGSDFVARGTQLGDYLYYCSVKASTVACNLVGDDDVVDYQSTFLWRTTQ